MSLSTFNSIHSFNNSYYITTNLKDNSLSTVSITSNIIPTTKISGTNTYYLFDFSNIAFTNTIEFTFQNTDNLYNYYVPLTILVVGGGGGGGSGQNYAGGGGGGGLGIGDYLLFIIYTLYDVMSTFFIYLLLYTLLSAGLPGLPDLHKLSISI